MPLPVANGRITQVFGRTNEPLDSGGFNKGLDVGVPVGTTISSVTGGKVVHVGDAGDGWGVSVKVRDSQGNIHNYGHLSGANVRVGDTVSPGQAIAKSGNTGASTGPHLSYDVKGANGQYVDPSPWLGFNAAGDNRQGHPAIGQDISAVAGPTPPSLRPGGGGSTITLDSFMNALAGQESGGDYNARNSSTGAIGKYQILPSNWSAWAQQAGLPAGAKPTPENQERVARHKIQEYYNRFGNWGDVASAWYSGRPLSEVNATASQSNGPSIQSYVDGVLSAATTEGGGGDVPYQDFLDEYAPVYQRWKELDNKISPYATTEQISHFDPQLGLIALLPTGDANALGEPTYDEVVVLTPEEYQEWQSLDQQLIEMESQFEETYGGESLDEAIKRIEFEYSTSDEFIDAQNAADRFAHELDIQQEAAGLAADTHQEQINRLDRAMESQAAYAGSRRPGVTGEAVVGAKPGPFVATPKRVASFEELFDKSVAKLEKELPEFQPQPYFEGELPGDRRTVEDLREGARNWGGDTGGGTQPTPPSMRPGGRDRNALPATQPTPPSLRPGGGGSRNRRRDEDDDDGGFRFRFTDRPPDPWFGPQNRGGEVGPRPRLGPAERRASRRITGSVINGAGFASNYGPYQRR